MAFQADWGMSTVLWAQRVTSTVGFLVRGDFRATGRFGNGIAQRAKPEGRDELKTQN